MARLYEGPWRCDRCQGQILSPEDGWVEWLTTLDGQCWGLKLVHSASYWLRQESNHRCQYKESSESGRLVQDLPLAEFVGYDGLIRFLDIVSEGRLPLTEILQMIQRIHIPGYDSAHPYFAEMESNGYISRRMNEGLYFMEQIEIVLDSIEEETT